MSPSSETFMLRLPSNSSLTVTVLDADLAPVTTPVVNGALSLPRGLYSVRVAGPTGFEENLVRLDRDVDLSAMAPKRFSAAPIRDSQLTQEYYAGPSAHFSRTLTRPPKSPLDVAEILIFVRAIDRTFASMFYKPIGLTLYRADGSVETSFRLADVERNTNDGWLAFSTKLKAGFYRLRSGGDHPREIAVHVFPKWQTQIFLLMAGGAPLLEAARIFLAETGAGFSPDDTDTQLVDDGIAMMADPSASPPIDLLRGLLDAKFDNPVLGLIGAHLLLRERQRGRELPENRRFDLTLVLQRLQGMLGTAPDVKALRVASLEPGDAAIATFQFDSPPMLLAGVRALVDASTRHPDLVQCSEFVDDVTEHLQADSVWTTWESLPEEIPGYYIDLNAKYGHDRSNWKFINTSHDDSLIPVGPQTIGRPRTEWLYAGILDTIEHELARDRRSPNSTLDVSARTPGISVIDLAKQLEVTPQRIERAVRELDTMDAMDLAKIVDNPASTVPGLVGGIAAFVRGGK